MYAVFLLVIGFFLFFNGKEESFLVLNRNYNIYVGQFFRFYTHVGDGLFFIGFVLIMLFVNYYYALAALTCYAIPSLVSQLLKKVVFTNFFRPIKYFEGKIVINTTEGVINHAYNSFPSGHTLTAFAMFFFLSLLTSNKLLQSMYLFCAILVAISRVYIAQHFVEDTYFGSIIGVVLAYIICFAFNNYTKLSKTKFFQKSLLTSH